MQFIIYHGSEHQFNPNKFDMCTRKLQAAYENSIIEYLTQLIQSTNKDKSFCQRYHVTPVNKAQEPKEDNDHSTNDFTFGIVIYKAKGGIKCDFAIYNGSRFYLMDDFCLPIMGDAKDIIQFIPIDCDQILDAAEPKDDATDSADGSSKQVVAQDILQYMNEENKNKRTYTEEVLAQAINSYRMTEHDDKTTDANNDKPDDGAHLDPIAKKYRPGTVGFLYRSTNSSLSRRVMWDGCNYVHTDDGKPVTIIGFDRFVSVDDVK